MSTKNVTATTSSTQNQYNPAAMMQYNAFQPALGAGLMDLASNPLTSTYFNQQLQMGRKANAAGLQSQNQALMRNLNASGPIANKSAFMQSQLARNQRAGMQANSNLFSNLLLNAQQNRMKAYGMMEGYSPLQTGQISNSTQTQSQQGLGSWLPQVMSLATAPFTGGKSLMGLGNGFFNGAGSTGTFNTGNYGGAMYDVPTAPSFGGVPGGTGNINNPFLG